MIDLADEPLLVREEGSATRRVTERALEQAGVGWRVSMELVAFVSVHALRGEVAGRRLVAIRLRRLRIQRHFHVIHSEARTLSVGARALVAMLSAAAKRG